jgi:hypothetical protein
MRYNLTCANHSEIVMLEEIGFMRFVCPQCGGDYSIGRKIILEEPRQIQMGK